MKLLQNVTFLILCTYNMFKAGAVGVASKFRPGGGAAP
jgi:hypothetical protein